jgi:hypothetical protein
MVSHAEQHKTPVQAALDLYTALRGSQPGDMGALTTPGHPLPARGPSRPHPLPRAPGHGRPARCAHAAYGNYTVTIIGATEQPGPQVTIRARIDPQSGHGTPSTKQPGRFA